MRKMVRVAGMWGLCMVFACVAHLSARDLRMIAIGHSYFAGDDDINTIVPQMIGLRTDDNLTIEFKLCWAHMLWMHHLYDTLIAADAWPSTNQSDTAEKRVAYAAQWQWVVDRFADGPVDYVMFVDGVSNKSRVATAYGIRLVAHKLRELSPDVIILPYAQQGFGTTYEGYVDVQNSITAARYTAITDLDSMLVSKYSPGGDEVNQRKYRYQEILRGLGERMGPVDGDAFVVTAGEAFRIVHREKNDLSLLYRSFSDEDPHGNLWGNYLESCVIFSIMTGQRFDGRGYSETLTSPQAPNTLPEEYRGTIPDEWARYFEDVAFRAYSTARAFRTALDNGTYSGPWVPPVDTGTVVLRSTYYRAVDAAGRVTETATVREDSSHTGRTTFQYDSEDRLSSQTGWTDGGDTATHTSYTYVVDNGLITKREYRDASGALIGEDRYTYNASSQLTEEAFYEPDNSVDARYTYTYDGSGRVSSRSFYSASGDLVTTWYNVYGSTDQPDTVYKVSAQSGDTSTTAYTYASVAGGATKVSASRTWPNSDPSQVVLEERTYNGHGDLATHSMYRVSGGASPELSAVTTYVYEYGVTAIGRQLPPVASVPDAAGRARVFGLNGRQIGAFSGTKIPMHMLRLTPGVYIVERSHGNPRHTTRSRTPVAVPRCVPR